MSETETEGFEVRASRAKRQRVLEVSGLPEGNSSTPPGRREDKEPEVVISEYELQRLERIKRNNAFIASLSVNSLEKVGTFLWLSRRRVDFFF